MFRAYLKAHTRLLAFFLIKETPTHERTAVQTFVCVLLAVLAQSFYEIFMVKVKVIATGFLSLSNDR